jgi:hypothetical protein
MTAVTDTTPTVDARHARLVSGMAGVKSRSAGVNVEKVLQIAGSILLPTGLVVIVLGWYGASRTSYDFQQIPYLISGGLLGAAMTVAGGFLYFGYWLTRLVHENQRQRAELGRVLALLDERLSTTPGSSAPAGTAALVSTATGSLVHRADCALVRGKAGVRAVSASEASTLKPCKVCQPFEGA